ncbi:MAG TPA: helix-turn-helix transcriptional regulator [Abditibacteriaceae bacterium]|nr:helix-turn-helix transcriptional regulator [Abditibacteriaceae bacterium]
MQNEQKKGKPSNGHDNFVGRGKHGSHRPVYHISIVAEMVETHPQTLRMYERMGLVSPQRTRHNVRLYSDEDVEHIRRIQHLTQQMGVNLAGVEVVFDLLREMERMRAELEAQMEAMRAGQQQVISDKLKRTDR